jgi:hypothetical protein
LAPDALQEEFQARCLRSVEFQSLAQVCRRVRFGCMGFRSVGMDRFAVAGAVAVAVAGAAVVAADVVVDAAGAVVAVVAVVAVAETVVPHVLRDSRLEIVVDQNESTFFVSCRRMTRSDLTSSALSEW